MNILSYLFFIRIFPISTESTLARVHTDRLRVGNQFDPHNYDLRSSLLLI